MSEWTQRREKYRSKRYIPEEQQEMTNQEKRELNNQPITEEKIIKNSSQATKGKIISEKLYEKLLDGDKLDQYVNSLIKNALEGNASAMIELNNRIEGKVRDEIHVDYTIGKHIPDQDKQADILQKYRQQKEEQEQAIQ